MERTETNRWKWKREMDKKYDEIRGMGTTISILGRLPYCNFVLKDLKLELKCLNLMLQVVT